MGVLTAIRLYTIEELREEHIETYEKLHEDYKSLVNEYSSPWSGEVVDCIKAFVEFLDLKLIEYTISSWHTELTVRSGGNSSDHSEDLCGARAYAYIMNRLDQYRIPYGCKHKDYKRYMSYGKCYRAGKVEPTPLTGYYLDDVFIEKTLNYVLNHGTLKEAVESLSFIITESLANDEKQEQSEESFELWCGSDLFTCNGTKINKTELELRPC